MPLLYVCSSPKWKDWISTRRLGEDIVSAIRQNKTKPFMERIELVINHGLHFTGGERFWLSRTKRISF
jgi:hypothetical protein